MAQELEGGIVETTIIYYTANTLREPFATKVRDNLLKVKGDLPLISISHKPMDFGTNYVFEGERCTKNIYMQILEGAKRATTKWIAMAEDDTLYSPEHFKVELKEDGFWYDMSRWSIYTWTQPPMYSLKYRTSMTTCICTRELFIELMEKRLSSTSDNILVWSEPGKYDHRYGIGDYKVSQFSSKVPSIVFSHPDALGYLSQGERKGLGEIRAFDIPYWGKASDIISSYYL